MDETKKGCIDLLFEWRIISFAYIANERKFVEKHVDSVFALAPAIYVNRFNWPFVITSLYGHLAPREWSLPVDSVERFVRSSLIQVCKTKPIRSSLCKIILNQIYGTNALDQTVIDLELLEQTARPMSSVSLSQITQVSLSGKLSQYDHLMLGNLISYKQLLAPTYNLTNIKLNHLLIFFGTKDSLVD